MLPKTDKQYREIAQRAAVAFLKIPGVHAVGVGGGERGGKPTGEPAIKVCVVDKRVPSDVNPTELIPTFFEDVATDVVQVPQVTSAAAAIPGAPPNSAIDPQNVDDSRYRPIRGGIQIQTGNTGLPRGTLGFLAEVVGDSDRVVGITNSHVLFATAAAGALGGKVSQPLAEESCFGCCSGVFGEVKAGEALYEDDGIDAALISLDPGTEWRAEIEDIGPVRGMRFLTVDDIRSQTYQVKKRGRTTRLTGGTIQGINFSGRSLDGRHYINATGVKPNPLPEAPDKAVEFIDFGDSGSALLNMDDEVVALIFGKSEDPDKPGWGMATELEAIFNKFSVSNGLNLKVATSTAAGVNRVVPGLPAVAQAPQIAQRFRADLKETEEGQRLIELWLRHSAEINSLVNGNRKVGAQWRLAGGREVFKAMMEVVDQGSALPCDVDGRPFDDCLAGTIKVIQKYGSPTLSKDLAALEMRILPCAGSAYQDILARLTSPKPAPDRFGGIGG